MRTLPMTLLLVALSVALGRGEPVSAQTRIPPLKTAILAPTGEVRGEARIYPDYIEVVDSTGAPRGAIGAVMVQGRLRLFLIKSDEPRTFLGWAEHHRLYNVKNELIGYYYWTPTFSYVYDPRMKKMGEARCLAYQGVCAAAIAGYLLGLL